MITSPALSQAAAARQWFLARADLGALVEAIRGTGRRVIGPTILEDAIVYDEIHSAADLPAGWRDVQTAGRYRLEHGGDTRVFGYSVGPTPWKRFTFPPNLTIAAAHRSGAIGFDPAVPDAPQVAFLGVRACEIAPFVTPTAIEASNTLRTSKVNQRRFIGRPGFTRERPSR